MTKQMCQVNWPFNRDFRNNKGASVVELMAWPISWSSWSSFEDEGGGYISVRSAVILTRVLWRRRTISDNFGRTKGHQRIAFVRRLKSSTDCWEWAGAKQYHDLQGTKWPAIESLPSYIEGHQHMTAALKFAAKFGTHVLRYCCPLQETV
jgi:hypothetical protein